MHNASVTHIKLHKQRWESCLRFPPPILYLSFQNMEIPSVSLLSLKKKHAPWSMSESAYPPKSLTRVLLPSFIHRCRVSWEPLMDSPGQYWKTNRTTNGLIEYITEKHCIWLICWEAIRLYNYSPYWRVLSGRSSIWSAAAEGYPIIRIH